MPRVAVIALVALWTVLSARAADAPSSDPGDDAALKLADKTATPLDQSRSWRAFAEGAASRAWLREPSSRGEGVRAALDVRWDAKPFSGFRAVFSNRLDVVRDDAGSGRRTINTLREAYVSWQGMPDVVVDAGRVNLRNGVAWGYNPTDFFKTNALRTIVSPDPANLRENRMGAVLVQIQKISGESSVSVAYSPKLADAPSDAAFSPDFGSTNSRHRWLVATSRRWGESFNPQLLVYGGESMRPQAGLNVSTLLNKATVAFIEYSAGKGRSLAAQSLGFDEPDRWQQRAALGLTYTTPFNLSLTVEGDFNSAAPDRARWGELSAGSPSAALRFAGAAQAWQELPVRRAAFLYATWRDALLRRVDVSGFWREDVETRSRAQWLETRYHFDRADLALQWQIFGGRPDSFYGGLPVKQRVEVSLRGYF